MEHPRTAKIHNHAGRRFALVTTIYILGILAFSSWSYLEHQAVIKQNDGMEAAMQRRQIHKIALVESMEVVFLMAMLVPIIALYHNARAHSLQQEEELNAKLKYDNGTLKTREKELEEAIEDLERFNAVSTGRELRIIELKSEVNALLEKLNLPKRYTTASAPNGSTKNEDG